MDFRLSLCTALMLRTVSLVSTTRNCVAENGKLNVNNTNFTNLRDYYCSGEYKNLHTIHLVNNNLSFLEATAFHEVSWLKHLLIIQNPLEYLDPNLFSNLKELVSLDLSHNKLKSLTNERLFSSQSKLKFLRLSYNEIISLDSRVLMPLWSLEELSLSNNPFSCDCSLIRNTVKWCKERNLTTGAKCQNGPLWTELRYENCPYYREEESIKLTCILAGAGVVIVIIVAVSVDVLVHRSRKSSRRDGINGYNGTRAYSLATEDFSYEIIPDTHQRPPHFIGTLSCNKTDPVALQEYAEVIIKPSELQDTETFSSVAAAAADDSAPYAEPLRHWTKEASATYAEPYQQTAAMKGRVAERFL